PWPRGLFASCPPASAALRPPPLLTRKGLPATAGLGLRFRKEKSRPEVPGGYFWCSGRAGSVLRIHQAAALQQGLDVGLGAGEGVEQVERGLAAALGEEGGAEAVAVLPGEAAVFFDPLDGVGVQ